MRRAIVRAASLLVLCSLSASAAPAEEPAKEIPKELRAVRLQEAVGVHLDGLLDEPAWQLATPASGFVQIDPDHGQPAPRDTEVRVLFDDRALYVGVVCHDDQGIEGVRVPDLRRDFDYIENDVFGIVLDPFSDERTSQNFQVNPWGALRDLRTFGDQTDESWDAGWSARTKVSGAGWTAEIEIPWSTLRYPADATSWRVNFLRRVRRVNELSGWQPWQRGMLPYRTSFGGALTGLVPPPPRRELRLQPYVLARAGESRSRDGKISSDDVEIGGDLKWLPNPSTVVDVTVNTDFAQVDADRQVVNLSRFSVFFPEKRPFFLENAGLFDSGFNAIKPFFSRRIGIDADGLPVPIDIGARVIHQDERETWGGLVARTGETESAAAATFAVGRWNRNVGKSHRVGAMVVGRGDESRRRADGIREEGRDNGVFVLDGSFRPNELFTVNGFVSASSTTGEGGDDVAASIWAYSEGPRGYFGWIQQYIGAEYQADAGFVSRRDLILTSPAVTLDWRPKWLPKSVRRLRPNFSANVYHRASDRRFEEGSARIEPLWVVFQGGSEVWAWWQPNAQRLAAPFEPLPGLRVEAGRYDYDRFGIAGATDRSRPYGVEVRHVFGGYFDGRLATTNVTLRAAPSPRVAFSLDYELNELESVGAAGLDRKTELWAPELRLALDPRRQLSVFYQRNTAAELDSWYARLSWELKPLSYAYLVLGDLAPIDPDGGYLGRPDVRNRQAIFKLVWSLGV